MLKKQSQEMLIRQEEQLRGLRSSSRWTQVPSLVEAARITKTMMI